MKRADFKTRFAAFEQSSTGKFIIVETYATSDGPRNRVIPCGNMGREEVDRYVKWLDAEANAVSLELVGLRRQRDELHETTNRYLERARRAEAELAEYRKLGFPNP